MQRIAHLAYAAFAYAFFFATFAYMAGFLTNQFVPKSIDSGAAEALGTAVAIDLGLLALFAIQHSGMARPAFKRAWTRLVPQPIERATYVLLSSVVLIAAMAYWQPIPGNVWHFESPLAQAVGYGLFGLGLATIFYSTVLIDHFELFGLRQVWDPIRGNAPREDTFEMPSLYRFVRHPLYVGWFIALWATPSMTTGHLLFAGVCSAYVVVAVRLEERDLVDHFGRRYEAYQQTTPMFIPTGPSTREGAGVADPV